ncbi:MAG: cytochrome c oxidase subunit 4 [Actinomycetota bacterium]
MSTQVKFLIGAGCFAVVVAIVYWYLGYESAGFTMLLFMGIGAAFIGTYILLHGARERRMFTEDNPNADHEKQAGERVGWFSAGSIWPLVMGLGLAVGLQGFVYGAWLFILGAVLFAWAAVGLMMESRG